MRALTSAFFGIILATLCLNHTGAAAQLGRTQPTVVDNTRAGGASANKATGLQLSLFAPAQIFPVEYDVYGLRINLFYGVNQNLRGLDMGVVNVGAGLMEGLQLGAANRVNSLAGAQIGFYNSISVSEGGCFQMGAINHGEDFMGAQLGVMNYARHVNGAQIGLINICDTTDGLQIGIINIISQSSFLVFCPLINGQF
ncbi:MAG: LA_2272 family surface repeat-containing protein [Kiritimatiellia bacterium]|nr:hypothetical protein [Lentisphaerota bacterium]